MTLAEQIERAFDYRGYVTVSRHDGGQVVGYIYDRGPTYIEMFDETATRRIRLPVDEVAAVALTGDDTAARAQRMWEKRKGALEPTDASVWGSWEEERPILVVAALPQELRSVAAALDAKIQGTVARGRFADVRTVALTVGIGGGAAQIVAREKPRLVVSCGFSGALDPLLEVGDVVLATQVTDELGESIAAPAAVLAAARQALGDARFAEGEIFCSTEVAATPAEKQALAKPGRLAVDLESGPAARAAVRAGIPWLAVRVIIDPLDVALPAFTREARRSYLGPALLHALRGPRATVELARLGLRARAAGHALEAALRRLGPALGALASEAAP